MNVTAADITPVHFRLYFKQGSADVAGQVPDVALCCCSQ